MSMPASVDRSAKLGLIRGLKGRCPNCGEGKLFRAYLKIKDECEVCHHAIGAYAVDDGPAYFTILLVGHVVLGPLLAVEVLLDAPMWLVMSSLLMGLTAVTLVSLPIIKGGFLGVLWATRAGQD